LQQLYWYMLSAKASWSAPATKPARMNLFVFVCLPVLERCRCCLIRLYGSDLVRYQLVRNCRRGSFENGGNGMRMF
jgi:hypothetical protein